MRAPAPSIDDGENLVEPLRRGNIRLAATVVLARQAAEGIEVFMIQRPGRGDFPNLHVFPGGKVDRADHMPELCEGVDEAAADRTLGVLGGGLRYWVAAIRECFEECGVLFAKDGGNSACANADARRRYGGYRAQLIDGRLGLASLCAREGLRLACDEMLYFSHWLTPEAAPRRFDTRFFVAAMPAGQDTLAHETETQHSCWIRPAEAIRRCQAGAWPMIAPTITTLRMIEPHKDCAALLDAVREESHLPELTPELRWEGMRAFR